MESDHSDSPHRDAPHESTRHYTLFAVNMMLSLIVMYFVMFSMIDAWSDFRHNLNMFYMALTMVAPMGVIMLLTMRTMYARKWLNLAIHAALVLTFMASLAATRQQSAIGDRQFIASMVPHHSGAILMCREARLRDAELSKLCEEIARAQRREIEQMNAIRARLESKARES